MWCINMDISLAIKRFRDFCHAELDAKGGAKHWYKIDGSRICNECTRHKRKTLYAYIKEGSGVFLKCFRASCELRRFATLQDFHDLGFHDEEAIKTLLDKSNRSDTRQFSLDKRPIIVSDWMPSKEQLEYFKSRTNIKLRDVAHVQSFRIIPNIYQVLHENFDDDEPIIHASELVGVDKSAKDAITFATEDYSTFSYRHIKQKNKKLVLNPDKDNVNTGYTLTRGNDVKTLVVTEGVFDLINVYTKYAILDNAKYIATFGFASFVSDIIYHYKQHITSVKSLIIFADSDIKLENGKFTYNKQAYNKLIKTLNDNLGDDAFENIVIVYNKASKDFGDMRETIQPEINTVVGDMSKV